MKCRREARQRRARPRMASKVERILVALGLVLVLKTVPAIRTLVLLLLLMCTSSHVRIYVQKTFIEGGAKYLSSSWESNFLGFLGQHSQMKPPCVLGLPCEFAAVSGSFRELVRCLVSDNALPWFVLEIEPRGLGFRDRDRT